MFSYVDPNLCWEDLKWIRKESKGASLVVKGIGSIEVSSIPFAFTFHSRQLTVHKSACWYQDAVMAIEAGVDGLVL